MPSSSGSSCRVLNVGSGSGSSTNAIHAPEEYAVGRTASTAYSVVHRKRAPGREDCWSATAWYGGGPSESLRHHPEASPTWKVVIDHRSAFPKGATVNDGISPRLCLLSYASVDDAVRMVQQFGHGSMLAKFDIEMAYRIVPVHPQDRLLLGWYGRGSCSWTECCRLDCGPPQSYLTPLLMPFCG